MSHDPESVSHYRRYRQLIFLGARRFLSFFSRDKAVKPPPGKPLEFIQPAAWQIRIDGELAKPMTLDMALFFQAVRTERTYLPVALRGGLVDGDPLDRF